MLSMGSASNCLVDLLNNEDSSILTIQSNQKITEEEIEQFINYLNQEAVDWGKSPVAFQKIAMATINNKNGLNAWGKRIFNKLIERGLGDLQSNLSDWLIVALESINKGFNLLFEYQSVDDDIGKKKSLFLAKKIMRAWDEKQGGFTDKEDIASESFNSYLAAFSDHEDFTNLGIFLENLNSEITDPFSNRSVGYFGHNHHAGRIQTGLIKSLSKITLKNNECLGRALLAFRVESIFYDEKDLELNENVKNILDAVFTEIIQLSAQDRLIYFAYCIEIECKGFVDYYYKKQKNTFVDEFLALSFSEKTEFIKGLYKKGKLDAMWFCYDSTKLWDHIDAHYKLTSEEDTPLHSFIHDNFINFFQKENFLENHFKKSTPSKTIIIDIYNQLSEDQKKPIKDFAFKKYGHSFLESMKNRQSGFEITMGASGVGFIGAELFLHHMALGALFYSLMGVSLALLMLGIGTGVYRYKTQDSISENNLPSPGVRAINS